MNEPLITVTGNVGTEPRTNDNRLSFTLATTPRIKKDGEWVDGETIWFRVTLWGRDAQLPISKGDKVMVTGRLQLRTYNKDGEARQSLEINGDGAGMIPKGERRNGNDDWAAPF